LPYRAPPEISPCTARIQRRQNNGTLLLHSRRCRSGDTQRQAIGPASDSCSAFLKDPFRHEFHLRSGGLRNQLFRLTSHWTSRRGTYDVPAISDVLGRSPASQTVTPASVTVKNRRDKRRRQLDITVPPCLSRRCYSPEPVNESPQKEKSFVW
jgi:hypothetical protein